MPQRAVDLDALRDRVPGGELGHAEAEQSVCTVGEEGLDSTETPPVLATGAGIASCFASVSALAQLK